MAQRDELYKKFGPLFLEAMTLTTLDLINEILKHPHPQPYTSTQIMAKILDHLTALEPYDWMPNPIP